MRMKIPAIPAPIRVTEENPIDGCVAGCDGDAVVCRIAGVSAMADTVGTGEVFIISPNVLRADSLEGSGPPAEPDGSAAMAKRVNPGDIAV